MLHEDLRPDGAAALDPDARIEQPAGGPGGAGALDLCARREDTNESGCLGVVAS